MGIDALIVVTLCTLVQNIFGVGILVFGTPILLGLGYDYLQSIGLLLPCSFGVSLLQVLRLSDVEMPDANVLCYSMVGVICGVSLLSFLSVPVIVYAITCVAMFFAATLRFHKPLRKRLATVMLSSNTKFYLFNGIFHGFSNLGGILLVVRNNLEAAHHNQSLFNTAIIYLVYVIFQMISHTYAGQVQYFIEGVYLAPFAFFISWVMGRKQFDRLSVKTKDNILGLFFVSVGAILAYKAAALIIF